MDILPKAQRAATLLSDPVLREAIDGLRAEQVSVFASRVPAEHALEARHIMWALAALEARLSSFVDDGELFKRRQNKVAPQ